MPSLDIGSMREFLSRSIPSLNSNKLYGIIAEVELRNYLVSLGFDGRISPGGWILRREGSGFFGHNTAVVFPEKVAPGVDLSLGRAMPEPPHGLHTICSTFHQSGIHAYFCAAEVPNQNDPLSMQWKCVQLGLPTQQPWQDFPDCIAPNFRSRARKYQWLRHKTVTTTIPDDAVAEEFSKEHLRVTFQTPQMAEISDVDGILWGEQYTYPLEIKEKTAANSTGLGDFFGLDVGPFVKLAFYAAKRGNLHSLFIVREIDDPITRNLVNWWFITFEQLALFASWTPQAGGKNMKGGGSSVVRIPKCEFQPLNAANLATL